MSRIALLVGLQAEQFLSDTERQRMLRFLESEVRRWKELYSHSPLMLVANVADELLEHVRTSAATLGIPVIGNRTAITPALLEETCHVLIAISLSTRTQGSQDFCSEDGVPDLDPDGDSRAPSVMFDTGSDLETPAGVSGLRAASANQTPIQQQRLEELLFATDRFNCDGSLLAKTHASAIAANTTDLAPDPIAGLMPRTLNLRAIFGIADTLAAHYQAKTRQAFKIIFGLAAAATACFGFYLLVHQSFAQFTLGGYLFLLLAAYGIYIAARKADVHGRYIDYRALAEGLRIQFFWTACGIESEVADRYLRKHKEFAWIRGVIRIANSKLFAQGESNLTTSVAPRDVLAFWIANQRDYFARALAKAQLKERHARRVVGACFWLGVAATLTNIVLFAADLEHRADPRWRTTIALIMFLTPPISAGIIGLMHKMGYTYQAKHYSRMLDIYSRADAHSSHCADASVRAIAAALGEEALRENTEWSLFHRDKAVDEPAGVFKKPW